MAYRMRTLRTSRRWRLASPGGAWGALGRHGGRTLLVFMLLGPLGEAACAQNGRVELSTAPALWMTPSTEMPLVIRLQASQPVPPQAMLLVRGLPASVSLTEGRPFGPGVWVVPLNLVAQLRLRAPAENSRSDLSLTLVTLDGKPLAETKLTLFIAPPAVQDDTIPMATPPAKQMTVADRENALKLMDRGQQSLRAGNVSVAQKFYERAAERGLAEAALALAGTYDSRELARMNINVEPNPALAKQWYEKARQLGSREAESRLQGLR